MPPFCPTSMTWAEITQICDPQQLADRFREFQTRLVYTKAFQESQGLYGDIMPCGEKRLQQSYNITFLSSLLVILLRR